MANKEKRFYWLKLKRDFFKRHDIRIIESMPNGKDYILFYLKLLCESVDHEGNLRFSDLIPYNEEMLATITDTNIDIVRSALKVFAGLNMMEVLDDGTIYLNEVQKMIGCETEWAAKKRAYRTQKGQCPNDVPLLSDKSKSIELEKENRVRINNGGAFEAVFSEFAISEQLKEALLEFVKQRKLNKKPMTDKALKLLINKLRSLAQDEETQIAIINQAIEHGWLSVYPLKADARQGANGVKLSNEADHTLDGIL